MNATTKVAETAADLPFVDIIAEALTEGALPGEIEGFDAHDCHEAARFVAATAQRRPPGIALVRVESIGGAVGARMMRICIVNDDMPFLVDSVGNHVSGHGLIIHRLLHPVVCVDRDAQGVLTGIEPVCPYKKRESIMYLEVDRVDARGRQDILAGLHRVLADVRAAVADWKELQAAMRADADRVEEREGAELLRWFAGGAMTLLGYQIERPGEQPSQTLGIFRLPGEEMDAGGCEGAMAYFEQGGDVPLVAKSDRISSVHRRVPFDLVVVPVREQGRIAGIGVYAGLWTSQALAAPIEDVPMIRRLLGDLEQDFDFDPKGHSGKALRHAISSLPRDLLINLDRESVKQLVTTAMSLADRPRPTLVLVRSILRGHLFAFVWLPRDDLTTRRRVAIGEMIEQAAGGRATSWSVELGDGDLALIRYTLDITATRTMPDVAALDRKLDEMVRGWEPSVEEALGTLVGPVRATRLAMGYVQDFPEGYRLRTTGAEAAEDVLRICDLEGPDARGARLYRTEGDGPTRLRLKTYRLGGIIPLSEAVPVFENFGFRVLEEIPTPLAGERGYIHEFFLELLSSRGDADQVMARAPAVEQAIAAVLEGRAENDPFNSLLVMLGLSQNAVALFRASFRYLRQIGLSYSQLTVVHALRRAPQVANGLVALFAAQHDPAQEGDRAAAATAAGQAIEEGLAGVAAIDEDRVLRLIRSLINATLRTNAYVASGREALAFKLDSALVPGLPAPVPWREIWVYSPRVEGIHLRGGPVARGGLRWSDRRDDFRTEILGLMKAQVVKNAVIVPTGAKGGFFPKLLPAPSDREAWLKEGTESYRIFIRALLSLTDNIVDGKVVHPEGIVIRDGDDPYFVVAADKGTASFSDVANDIAVSRKFWLGDAFASGGSHGYDHKAMGITAKGAWISVQRHFLEMGVDVQSEPVRVIGVGDMSGDVFGNGMLLSKALKLVVAFDHRHIFVDPDPDPARSWAERDRMFKLPRSSWDDYDKSLISKGGGVFPRTQKSIPLSPEMQALVGTEEAEMGPAALIHAILKAEADLLWFGGIGTYVKSETENHIEVGDPSNDAVRVNGDELKVKVIGEGANLAVTQAGRIEFAGKGGRINTDFIDNSAGVDCSDNEVNIKIPLNAEMLEGKLSFDQRNAELAEMTDEVAALVLEDNRLQTLALSIAERGGAAALPQHVRLIEILENAGRLDRAVEGFGSNEELLRRAQEDKGLTRPELAVLLSSAKMALQAAIEAGTLAQDETLTDELLAAFPKTMQQRHGDSIRKHRLRKEIIATEIANRLVNRLGLVAAATLAEEEGASLAQVAAAFVAAERLFGMASLWHDIDTATVPELLRIELFEQAGKGLQLHIADTLRSLPPSTPLSQMVELLGAGLAKLDASCDTLLREEARGEGRDQRERLIAAGAPEPIARRIVRLYEMNGGVGIAMLGRDLGTDEIALTEAYTKLGEALGLDWAHNIATRFEASDPWERLLAGSLERDFEQLRLDFLERGKGSDPKAQVRDWLKAQAPRVDQFRLMVDRARAAPAVTATMLAQIATQARVLLAR